MLIAHEPVQPEHRLRTDGKGKGVNLLIFAAADRLRKDIPYGCPRFRPLCRCLTDKWGDAIVRREMGFRVTPLGENAGKRPQHRIFWRLVAASVTR